MPDFSFISMASLPCVILDALDASHQSPDTDYSPLLRQVIAQLSGLPSEQICLDRTPAGKPVVTNAPFHFSISHTDQWLALAFDHAPIGVDVESCRGQPSLKLARRFFTPEEVVWLDAVDPDFVDEAFVHLWVLKESFVKQQGSALARVLGRVAFIGDVPRVTGSERDLDKSLHCAVWSLDGCARIGVTWKTPTPPVFYTRQGEALNLSMAPALWSGSVAHTHKKARINDPGN